MEHIEGSGRPPRHEAAGNRKRIRPGDPGLVFGEFGELTPRTIKQANLNKEEEKKAYEMMAVQGAYLQILDALDYIVDPDGSFHSLAAIPATKIAIAYQLAKCGFRKTGTSYVTKADPQPAQPPAPLPGEGWHTPPTITYQHVERP